MLKTSQRDIPIHSRKMFITSLHPVILAACYFILLLPGVKGSENVQSTRKEKMLLDRLLSDYSKDVRPTDLVTVNFYIKVMKLVELDSKTQVQVLSALVMMQWVDPNLTWDSDYGVDSLSIPMSRVWKPDVMLYNTAEKKSEGPEDIYKAQVEVLNNGSARWLSLTTLQTFCQMNLKWFPLDSQPCNLIFGSNSLDNSKLQVRASSLVCGIDDVKAHFFVKNGQWQLTMVNLSENVKSYSDSNIPFSVLEYTLTWQRLPGYWFLYLICPCLLLSSISLFAFVMPAEGGERVGFGITTVLAMGVYLLIISNKLPEAAVQIPVLGVLYTVMLVIMVGITCMSIISTRLVVKKTKPPACLRRMLHVQKTGEEKHESSSATTLVSEEEGKVARESSEKTRVEAAGEWNPNDTEKVDWQEDWQQIVSQLDKKLFVTFAALAVILPAIVLTAYCYYSRSDD